VPGSDRQLAGFDPRADFNEDDTINAADLALLRANLGRRGDILLGAAVAAAIDEEPPLSLDLGPRGVGPVGLRIAPASVLAAVGQVVTLEVVAEAGARPVDAIEAYLDFDPAVLQAVDAAGAPATAVQPGTALPAVLLNRVDPAWGQVDFVASSAGGAAPGGQFTVARLRFKVLAAGQTAVRFSFSDWRPTDAAYAGESVLGAAAAAQVQGGAVNTLYLPVILRK